MYSFLFATYLFLVGIFMIAIYQIKQNYILNNELCQIKKSDESIKQNLASYYNQKDLSFLLK